MWGRTLAAGLLVVAACSGSGDGGDDAKRDGGGQEQEEVEEGLDNLDQSFDEVETTAGSFLELNGWMWFYTTSSDIGFTDITAMLDDLQAGGVNVVGIYAPYDGDVDKWLGAVPRDYYATPPQSGTLAELTAMIDAAHQRDMKVVSYFGNINVDRTSEFFRAAEEQYAEGDRTSPEVSAIHWADDDKGELPTPAFGPSEWAYSETAGAWYWSFWGEPGFDLDLAGARAEVAKAERFWLDTGLDGFMFDSGVADAALQEPIVSLPTTYTPNDKWLTFEATDAENADTYDRFGLTSWFNLEDNDEDNDYSLIATGDATADDLEEALAGADEAHANGKLTHAWSLLDPDAFPDPAMRAQEAALLAGAGIAYGAPDYSTYLDWPDDVRTAWSAVMAAVTSNPALWPSAQRYRVLTGDDPKTYAIRAYAADESQSALLVYNLQDRAATIPLDLTGSGIAPQTATVLASSPNLAPTPTTVGTWNLDLPAYGYALLEVETP
jgi:hypothetical protein